MTKKMTIALIVLIDLCSGLSLLQVRPAASGPAKLWNNAEVNVLRVRNRAVQDYEAIRLIYDIARQLQLQQLQEKEQASKPAGPGYSRCSMRLSISSKQAHTGRLASRLPVSTPSERIHGLTIASFLDDESLREPMQ